MYSDPVFLLVVLAAFTLLERRMYWAAGLVGILATAGRPVGLAITVGLVVRMLEMQAEARTKRTTATGSAHRNVARIDNSWCSTASHRRVRIRRSGEILAASADRPLAARSAC